MIHVHVLGFPEPIAVSSMTEGQIRAQLNAAGGNPWVEFRDVDDVRHAVRPSAVVGFSYRTS